MASLAELSYQFHRWWDGSRVVRPAAFWIGQGARQAWADAFPDEIDRRIADLSALSRSGAVLSAEDRRAARDLQIEGEDLKRLKDYAPGRDTERLIGAWLAEGDNFVVASRRWSLWVNLALALFILILAYAVPYTLKAMGYVSEVSFLNELAATVANVFVPTAEAGEANHDELAALTRILKIAYWLACAAAIVGAIVLLFLTKVQSKGRLITAIILGALPIATLIGVSYTLAHQANAVRAAHVTSMTADKRASESEGALPGAEAAQQKATAQADEIEMEIRSLENLKSLLRKANNRAAKANNFRDITAAVRSELSIIADKEKILQTTVSSTQAKLRQACISLYGPQQASKKPAEMCVPPQPAEVDRRAPPLHTRQQLQKDEERSLWFVLSGEQRAVTHNNGDYQALEKNHQVASAKRQDLDREVEAIRRTIAAHEEKLSAQEAAKRTLDRKKDRLTELENHLTNSTASGEIIDQLAIEEHRLTADLLGMKAEQARVRVLVDEANSRKAEAAKEHADHTKAARKAGEEADSARIAFVNSWGVGADALAGISAPGTEEYGKQSESVRSAFFRFCLVVAAFVGSTELQLYLAVIFLVLFLPWMVQMILGLPSRVKTVGGGLLVFLYLIF
jgi:hypothetical protein